MEILIAFAFLLLGGTLLIGGGELLVRGASQLAIILKISPLVIGLTIVAACTGAPELSVSLMSCFKENGSPDMALGNVIGSSICNILLILGIASIIKPLTVSSKLIKREMPIMVLVSLLLWGVIAFSTHFSDLVSMEAANTFMPQWSGFVFFALFIVYSWWTVYEARKEGNKKVQEDIVQIMGERKISSPIRSALYSILLIGVGLTLLIYGANWFVEGAVQIALLAGVSKLVIGLTVLAVGTSLPELVVSVIAVIQGRSDLAIGNVVGSNIFNILAVLGVTDMFTPHGIPVSHQAVYFDIPIMVAVALLGSYLCATGKRLSRNEGAMLLLCYVGYLMALLLLGPGLSANIP